MSEKIKILFPVDFSEQMEKSFPTAQYLAKVYDAEIHLLHVLEAPSGPMKIFNNFDEASARKKAAELMDKMIESVDGGIGFVKIVKIGKPYRKILEAANELSVNAIVMGTHGAAGVQELFAGTNTARVTQMAPCPVISIRVKPGHLGFNKILLPLDLTRETGEKLKLGIEFAQNFDASLVVLSMLPSNDEEAKGRMQKRMKMAVEHIRSHNVPVESTMVHAKGDVADFVIKYAHEVSADLICIMTQQERALRETLLGANASHVVNHSDIPVISIRPEKEYRDRQFSDAHFG